MIYKDITENDESRFDTLNYELARSLAKKYKNVIGLMKDQLGGKVVTMFFGLRAKTYKCLIHDGSEDKKTKGTKKCIIKNLNLKIINCLKAT